MAFAGKEEFYMPVRKNKRGRPPLEPEEYYGHNRIRRRLNKLWISDNPECIEVETYPGEDLDRNSEEFLYAPIECLRLAVKAKKLKRLQTGLWYCCMRRRNDDQSRTICIMYRMHYGQAWPLVAFWRLLSGLFERYYDITRSPHLNRREHRAKILAVLPSNISRTFEPPNRNTILIPHVAMYTLTRNDRPLPGT